MRGKKSDQELRAVQKNRKSFPPPHQKKNSPSRPSFTAMLATTSLPVAAGQGLGAALRSPVPSASRTPSRRPLRCNASASSSIKAAALRSTTATTASRASAARRRPLSSPPAAGYVACRCLASSIEDKLQKEVVFRAETRSPLFLLLGMPSLSFARPQSSSLPFGLRVLALGRSFFRPFSSSLSLWEKKHPSFSAPLPPPACPPSASSASPSWARTWPSTSPRRASPSRCTTGPGTRPTRASRAPPRKVRIEFGSIGDRWFFFFS